MASVLEASAHVPEPGWELLSPKHGVVEGSSCRGTQPKGTRPKAQAGALLFFSGRPGGHCGFAPLAVPRSQVQRTAGALSAKGIKQSFFFFLSGTPKWCGWDSPRHPPLSAGSILATQPAPRELLRGVQRPQRPISNPARALLSRRLQLLISETHLRSSLGKQL